MPPFKVYPLHLMSLKHSTRSTRTFQSIKIIIKFDINQKSDLYSELESGLSGQNQLIRQVDVKIDLKWLIALKNGRYRLKIGWFDQILIKLIYFWSNSNLQSTIFDILIENVVLSDLLNQK